MTLSRETSGEQACGTLILHQNGTQSRQTKLASKPPLEANRFGKPKLGVKESTEQALNKKTHYRQQKPTTDSRDPQHTVDSSVSMVQCQGGAPFFV